MNAESETIPAVPDDYAGADEIVQYALARVKNERVHAASWLEEAREQLHIAELCHHEAVMAERTLQRLVDGEMYRGGTATPDLLFEEVILDATPYGLHVAEQFRPPPAPAMAPADIEARNQAVLAALPALWARGGRILARDVWEVTGDTQAVVYRALKVLQERGALRLVKEQTHPGTNATCNSILPPLGEPATPEPGVCEISFTPRSSSRPMTEAIEHTPGTISPRKLERAKKLIADGLNLRTVHAMIDVDLADLQAALG